MCGSVFGRCCRKTHLSGEGHAAGQATAQELIIGQLLSRSCSPPPRLTIGLVAHAQDDFGGAVVAGDYVGRHEEAGGSCPGQAKVQDLQCAVGLHHDVAGLKVLDRKHNTNLIDT